MTMRGGASPVTRRAESLVAAIAIVAMVAACSGATARRRGLAPQRSSELSPAERARARTFLAPIGRPEGPGWRLRTSRWTGAFDDVDEDGRADCWVTYTDDTMGLNLLVWPSCEGDASRPAGTFRSPIIGMAALAVPPALATPSWVMWLARRLRGDCSIRCVGASIPGCEPPGPEWRWVLAAGRRERVDPGVRGVVAGDWQSTARGVLAGALIVPARTADAWLRALPHGLPSDPAAWILLDAGLDRGADPVRCGGFEISVEQGGILATDRRAARWRWLFRGLPDYGGFVARRSIKCIDGLVVAQRLQWPGDLVVADPVTGAWLLVSARDYEGVHHLFDAAMKRRLWRRTGTSIEPLEPMRSLVVPRAPTGSRGRRTARRPGAAAS
jgi:hypothetical protein